MSHRRVRPILAAAVAVPLLLPLLLTGCSPQQWGTAARVGDTRISVDRLQAVTKSVLESPLGERFPREAHADVQTDLLVLLVGEELISRAAQRNDVMATEAELAEARRRMETDPQLGPVLQALPAAEQDAFVRRGVLSNKLEQKLQNGGSVDQELTRVASEVGVEVNPRYGRYDGVNVTPLISGNLARTPVRPETQQVPQ